MDSPSPSYQSIDCAMKWANRFISSPRNFFICLKMLIKQQRKKRAEMRLKEWVVKTGSTSPMPSYNVC